MFLKLDNLTYIEGYTVNDLITDAMEGMLEHGQEVPSRNGSAKSLYNVELTIKNPRERHLNLKGRTSNLYQLIAESFWVAAGRDIVTGYLEFFLPRAVQYSDDGKTWRGAYGPRIYEYGQMDGVIERFKYDKMTRQAVVDIYQSEKDTPDSIRSEYGLEKTKDTPCNDFIFFWIEPDNTFHMKTAQRSGDLIFGAGSINMFEFSFLHEMVFQQVKAMYPEIEMGAYHHNTVNLHLYDFTEQQAIDVVENKDIQEIGASLSPMTQCIFPEGIEKCRKFFNELVMSYTKAIEGDQSTASLVLSIAHIFKRYGAPMTNNLLFEYAQLVSEYIHNKVTGEGSMLEIGAETSDTLYAAVRDCKFTKFDLRRAYVQ